MQYLSKKISLFLLCLAQLFVPVANFALALPCEEAPAATCKIAPCCVAEPTARMDCCEMQQASPVGTEPAPAVPAIPPRLHFDLAVPTALVETGVELTWTTQPDFTFPSFNTHFAGNQLYKFLAVFLI